MLKRSRPRLRRRNHSPNKINFLNDPCLACGQQKVFPVVTSSCVSLRYRLRPLPGRGFGPMTSTPKNSLAALFEGTSVASCSPCFGSLAGFAAQTNDIGPATTPGAAQDLGLLGIDSLLGHNHRRCRPSLTNWYYVTPRFTRLLSNLAVSIRTEKLD
jgi:hypothetical protein